MYSTLHMGLRGPPNEDQGPIRQLQLRLASLKRTFEKATCGFPPCFLSGMSSGRLLREMRSPPSPPLVFQRPVRPACRPPATTSSAKGLCGDHHAPGDGTHESTASGGEVPDSKEQGGKGGCDQNAEANGDCMAQSCGGGVIHRRLQ